MRMYFLVLRSLSGIQKGIQAGHSALAYANNFGRTKRYRDFYNLHKTFILLDGGTHNDMNAHWDFLHKLGVKRAGFLEPDLNDCLTAIAFVVTDNERLKVDSPIGIFLKQFKLASN